MAVVSSQQSSIFGAPFVFTGGTPHFVPLLPRCGFSAYGPQYPGGPQVDQAFAYFRGTPSAPSTLPFPIGDNAFAPQQPFDQAPFSWVQSVVPPVKPPFPMRGASVFIQKGLVEDWREAFHFERAAPIVLQTSVTPQGIRSSFVRAGGWWDILSDAPFFFAAGYAVHPPGPPPMKAFAEQQPDQAAPYTFTQSSRIPRFPSNITVTDFAYPPQHLPDTAPWSFTTTGKPATQPEFFRPFGFSIFVPPLDDGRAPNYHVRGPFTPAANTQANTPPLGGYATGIQQPFDAAAAAFTNFVMPAPGNIPPFGAQILTRQHDDPRAPWVWVAYRVITTIQLPRPGVFARLHDDAAAAFAFFRDHPPIPFVPGARPSITNTAFGLQLPGDAASYAFTQFTPPVSLLVLPSGTSVFPQQTYDPRDLAGSFNFLWPGLLQETAPPIVGLLLQQAIYNVVNAGLSPFVLYAPSTTVPPDIVLSQSPPAGTLLPVNSVVTITASSGPASPQYGQVAVPNVIGMFPSDATTALFNAGLSLGAYQWVSSPQTAGTVVMQSLPPASLATIGTVVVLTLSQGPAYPSYAQQQQTNVPP